MNRYVKAAATACLLHCAAAAAVESETHWMKVLLDGRKVGQLQSVREVDGDRVTSIERMRMTFDRAGVNVAIGSEERSVETLDGKPLGFSTRTELSGVETLVEGVIDAAGKVQLVLRSGKTEQQRSMEWPEGALLVEGMRLQEMQRGLQPGTRYRVLAFQPSSLIAVEAEIHVLGKETVQVDGALRELIRVNQKVELPGAPLTLKAWVDAEHDVLRATLPILGVELEMVACSEACATAPNQPADILNKVMVEAPRALSDDERRGALRYSLVLRDEVEAQIDGGAEQRGVRTDDGWQIDVFANRTSQDMRAPGAADRGANRWLNSDDASVQALAREAAGARPSRDKAQLMRTLESFVRTYISNKSMRIGYASAAETVASREGDCTEHAVLLAALGRSLGVPTRVVNGLAYAPAFAGRDRIFVPHAWVQAWDGARWRSYDAALPGFDAGHIAFSTGDGDAASFYAGVALLGNIQIRSIEALPIRSAR